MIVVLEGPAATHGDEPRIPDLGEDHPFAHLALVSAKGGAGSASDEPASLWSVGHPSSGKRDDGLERGHPRPMSAAESRRAPPSSACTSPSRFVSDITDRDLADGRGARAGAPERRPSVRPAANPTTRCPRGISRSIPSPPVLSGTKAPRRRG